jgi:hypothetical protein
VSQHQGSSSSPSLSIANNSNGLTNIDSMTRYKGLHSCYRGVSCPLTLFTNFRLSTHSSNIIHLSSSTREFPFSSRDSRVRLHLSKKTASTTNALALALWPRHYLDLDQLPVTSSILILSTHSCRSPSNTTPLSSSLVHSKHTLYAQHSPIKQLRRCLNNSIHQSKHTS